MTGHVDGNVGVAIGLVCVAGASTAIGSSIVFFPSVVKRTSPRVLAAALGLSAGVMVYISMVEIFAKSVAEFVEAGRSNRMAYVSATLSLFGGVLFMMIADACIKFLTRDRNAGPIRRDYDEDIEIVWNDDHESLCEGDDHGNDHHVHQAAQQERKEEEQEFIVPHHCMGCADDPVAELEEWHELAELEIQARLRGLPTEINIGRRTPATTVTTVDSSGDDKSRKAARRVSSTTYAADEESGTTNTRRDGPSSNSQNGHPTSGGTTHSQDQQEIRDQDDRSESLGPPLRLAIETVPRSPDEECGFRAPPAACSNANNPKEQKRRLVKMGLSTAVAIGLHNFPEGLATFVAALDDPSIGAVLAVASGIHNIPEGICVSLPIYYATGSRWKAFAWGVLSGLSEPLAAVLGWAVLASVVTDVVYAVMFGFVAGMMLIISLKEAIPTAHRYDPGDTVVTNSLVAGMGAMALSLVLYNIKAD